MFNVELTLPKRYQKEKGEYDDPPLRDGRSRTHIKN
jgi:hypothetical protein